MEKWRIIAVERIASGIMNKNNGVNGEIIKQYGITVNQDRWNEDREKSREPIIEREIRGKGEFNIFFLMRK